MNEHVSEPGRYVAEQTPAGALADWVVLTCRQSDQIRKEVVQSLYEEARHTLQDDEQWKLLGNTYTGTLLALHIDDSVTYRRGLIDMACVVRGGGSPEDIHERVAEMLQADFAADYLSGPGEICSKSKLGYAALVSARPYGDEIWGDAAAYQPPPPGDYSDFWRR